MCDPDAMTFPLQCVCDCAGQCKATGQLMTAITHTRCREDVRYRWLLSRRPKSEWPEELLEPPPPPGILRTVSNFLGAAVQHVRTGMHRTPEAERLARLQVCEGCDRQKGGRCLECNCYIAVKAAWAEQECPLGRWELPLVP